MEFYVIIKAILFAILCGVTEFLPISSNGHVLVLEELLGFEGPPGKLFEISLQLGAILAVCWLYRARILHVVYNITRDPVDRKFALNVIIACIPAIVLGALFHHFLIEHFFNAHAVALMLIVGGIVILLVEKFKPAARMLTPDDVTWKTAIFIGLCQALALIPGVSRSGATIMGAMCAGVERKAATEFSFFLAIVMIAAASSFDMLIHRHELNAQGLGLIAVGFAVSFVSALIVVKWLLGYLSRHGFVAFAWYRIIVGSAVLALLWVR